MPAPPSAPNRCGTLDALSPAASWAYRRDLLNLETWSSRRPAAYLEDKLGGDGLAGGGGDEAAEVDSAAPNHVTAPLNNPTPNQPLVPRYSAGMARLLLPLHPQR